MGSEKQPSTGEIAHMFAHEVKNHLASIKLNIEMIKQDMTRKEGFRLESNRRRLERVEKSVELITVSVQDFLKLSNPLEMEPEEVSLSGLLAEVIDFIEPECHAAGIEIRLDVADGLPAIRTDRKNLVSALLNLIINSKEAIADKGKITVTGHDAGSGTVRVTVEDTGGGFAPERESKVFHDFFSTKENGTGLGLMIVKKIIDSLGGEILLKNRPGEGAMFIIDLPVHPGEARGGDD